MVPRIIASLLTLSILQLLEHVESQTDRFLLCAAHSKKTRSAPGYYVLQNVGMGRTLRTDDMMGNNTIVKFHIENLLNLNKRINAFVSLVPVDTNCSVTNLSIILFPKCKF